MRDLERLPQRADDYPPHPAQTDDQMIKEEYYPQSEPRYGYLASPNRDLSPTSHNKSLTSPRGTFPAQAH